jgi:ketosteroid isomerase-like protein
MTARELMTDYLAAARRGDWETAFGYFAEDIVMRVPGRSRLAGDRRGKQAAMDYIQRVREHYREGGIELELVDMLEGDRRVALLVVERFNRDGRSVEIRRANVYRVEDDAIVEITIFEADQYEVDELMSQL